MARFQHTVTLAPVPRRWFESCVVALHDLAEGIEAEGARLRLPDGRRLPELLLAQGAHLRPGARYHPENDDGSGPDIDQTLTILAWDRKRETALELVTLDDDPGGPGHMACTLRLTSAERPREARFAVKVQAGGGSWTKYAGGSGRLHLDLGKWWSQAAGRGRQRATPLTGRLDHALARATVTAVARPAGDGRWRVTVTVRVRGRSFARPLFPLAMTFMGRRARGTFSTALDDAAKQWNDQVPELLRKDMEQLPQELVESLFATDEQQTSPSLGR
ncbi:hypothetical protein [Streptomyces phaeochromogenes]|uniref:hypothetical protein n=1 Tax=Streptomyces phaeochromogenes TaxID=1923 RepID=UPI00386F0C5C|nr:hypothetical protein OG277_15700 [Streptomyces phaeochromogenes]